MKLLPHSWQVGQLACHLHHIIADIDHHNRIMEVNKVIMGQGRFGLEAVFLKNNYEKTIYSAILKQENKTK